MNNNTREFIGNLSGSLKQLLNPNIENKTILTSVSKNDKSIEFIGNLSGSLNQLLNPNIENKTVLRSVVKRDKSREFIGNLSGSLKQMMNPSKNGDQINELPKNDKKSVKKSSKPNKPISTKKISENEKLNIQEYINKLKEIISSLNSIIITEKQYDKYRNIVSNQTSCFDEYGKKEDCKKPVENENKYKSIEPSDNNISIIKEELDKIINSADKSSNKINDISSIISNNIKSSINKDDSIEELKKLSNTNIHIDNEEDKKKYDIIQTIIKKVLDILLTV
jgi:hypothetical protein